MTLLQRINGQKIEMTNHVFFSHSHHFPLTSRNPWLSVYLRGMLESEKTRKPLVWKGSFVKPTVLPPLFSRRADTENVGGLFCYLGTGISFVWSWVCQMTEKPLPWSQLYHRTAPHVRAIWSVSSFFLGACVFRWQKGLRKFGVVLLVVVWEEMIPCSRLCLMVGVFMI